MDDADPQAFRRSLDALAVALGGADDGFFDPCSVFWRVAREPALLLAGMPALLMQVAEPRVAQGVADHSRYRTDPLGRGIRTFTAVYAMVFGTRDEAVDAALAVHRVHQRVRGLVHEPLPAGIDPHYRADDPALLSWVAATLMVSSVTAYELFVAPLTAREKDDYCREAHRFGQLFGVPAAHQPSDWAALQARLVAGLDRAAAALTPAARDICRSLLWGTLPTRLLAPLNYTMAAMLLPESLARAYGLHRGPLVRGGFRVLVVLVRLLVRLVPRRWRGVPAARRAERRRRIPPAT